MDKFTDRLAILAGYLILYKLDTGPALPTEAEECTKEAQEQAEEVYKQIHDHQPNDQDAPAALAQPGGGGNIWGKTNFGLEAGQTKL